MAYNIKLKLSKAIEILNTDLVIVARQDDEKLGTLTISKGTIDWLPKNAKAGKNRETQLSWSKFAELMEKVNKR